jgi:hypothetical protein
MKNQAFKTSGRKEDKRLTGMSLLFLMVFILTSSCIKAPENFIEVGNAPKIFPEYYDLTLPPNIAPLNFIIKENGTRYRVNIHSGSGKTIDIKQISPHIKIPLDEWHNLLSENIGDSISIEVYTYQEKEWYLYKTIKHFIAPDSIDPWLAYRIVNAVYLKWRDMGIYQRNLTNFEEIPIIENSSVDHGCMNCHSFANRDPSKMMIHFRILNSGTLIWNEGRLEKVNTKTLNTPSAGIYPAWHPGGKYIAYSVGALNPHLTTRLNKVVDVADRQSDIILYNAENHTVITPPALSTKNRETRPAWSADGRYLYYLSAPEAVQGDLEILLHSKYSLMRISFNTSNENWGEPEMIMDADSTGMSISMLSVSPDGRSMVCAMTDYGYFTIFHKQSDLYCIDLQTREYHKLGLNSNSVESYSSWSSNGRWLVFSSKRMDDVLTRPYIAYIDKQGNSHNPFVLPQEDPELYYRMMGNYNRPELIKGKVELDPSEIKEAIKQKPLQAMMDR